MSEQDGGGGSWQSGGGGGGIETAHQPKTALVSLWGDKRRKIKKKKNTHAMGKQVPGRASGKERGGVASNQKRGGKH